MDTTPIFKDISLFYSCVLIFSTAWLAIAVWRYWVTAKTTPGWDNCWRLSALAAVSNILTVGFFVLVGNWLANSPASATEIKFWGCVSWAGLMLCLAVVVLLTKKTTPGRQQFGAISATLTSLAFVNVILTSTLTPPP